MGRASARSRVASGARHPSAWTESGLTYTNAPAYGATLATVTSFGADSWLSYSVTSLVTGNGSVAFAYTSASSSPISKGSV